MAPTLTNSVEEALHTAGYNSAGWVPEHEPMIHIIHQSRFGFLALLGSEDIGPNSKFKKTDMLNVPAVVASEPTGSMNPKVDQYVTFPTTFKANGAVTSWSAGTAKNITLDSTAGLKAYDIIRDRATGSEKRIQAVSSATVVSAIPFAGGASGAGTEDVADNADFDYAGSAWFDGATFGDGLRVTPQTDDNYCQIMADEYGEGIVQAELSQYPEQGKSGLEVNRRLTRVNHNRKRENRMIFGSKVANTDITSGSTLYGAAGLLGFSSRSINVGGSVTLDEWNKEVMPYIAQYGTGDYRALCGSIVSAVWADLAGDHVRTSREETMYGNKVKKIEATVEHITLHPTENYNNRPGEMLMFQPDMLVRKYFPKFNGSHLERIQARNTMKLVNAYMTVECLQARNRDVIGVVEGVLA